MVYYQSTDRIQSYKEVLACPTPHSKMGSPLFCQSVGFRTLERAEKRTECESGQKFGQKNWGGLLPKLQQQKEDNRMDISGRNHVSFFCAYTLIIMDKESHCTIVMERYHWWMPGLRFGIFLVLSKLHAYLFLRKCIWHNFTLVYGCGNGAMGWIRNSRNAQITSLPLT